MLEALFLGTGAGIPSRQRSVPGLAVRIAGEIVLLDCGEGTQRQLMVSPFSFMKIEGIFITHLHGDHILGLPGLLMTIGMSNRGRSLMLCGPPGIRKWIDDCLSACCEDLRYELNIIEAEDDLTMTFKGYSITAFATEHEVHSLGFKVLESPSRRFHKDIISENNLTSKDLRSIKSGHTVNGITYEDATYLVPGTSLVYTGDTVPCDSVRRHSIEADVLVHESTFMDSERDLAIKHGHSTSLQAADIAKGCNCEALILTHISGRYKDTTDMLNEAKSIFENTFIAEDMDLFEIGRGRIRLT